MTPARLPALRRDQQAMLTASAAYNIIGCGVKRHTAALRRVDHGCIYLMIAVRGAHALACPGRRA